MTDILEIFEGRHGVWVIYGYDHIPYALSIHRTTRAVIDAYSTSGGSGIAFWPLGLEFQDAIKEWESRKSEVRS